MNDIGRVGSGVGGCGCILMIVNFLLGGVCFDYCLWSILGKDIHWVGDVICGLFLGEVAIPLAIVCWIMRLFGVEVPFVS